MGQYYKPTLKQKGAKNWHSYRSWDFDNGAKLMEHSYIGNALVSYVKKLILSTPTQVVWGGDYADNEKGKGHNLYDLTDEVNPSRKKVGKTTLAKMRYLVNHAKKLYVDYSKVEKDTWGYRIDPLPLLTAEGNGRGGGDYEGSNMRLIGSWARDMISVEREIPIGYAELIPNFKEGREDDIIAIERLKGSNPSNVSESTPKNEREDEDESGSLLDSALGLDLLTSAIGNSKSRGSVGGSFGGGSTSGGGAGAKW